MSIKITQILILASAIACVFSSAALSAWAQTGNAGDTPFTGEWQTVSGSNYHYTVRLKQIGKRVTGSYSPGNGKIFDGVVVGDKLTFKWTQDGGYEGTGEFTLNDDRKGFTGSSTASKPTVHTNSWKTYTPPPPSSYAGTWATTSGFKSIALSISQKGDKVVGTFPEENGTIEGTVIDKTLRFKWESDAGSGSGQFRISTSGRTFTGWFNKGDDPDVEGTRWEGNRTSGLKASN